MEGMIALDVGTTHIKAVLFGEDGEELWKRKVPTPLEHDEWGAVYRPGVLWGLVHGMLLEACGALSDVSVTGIAVTGMAEAGLAVDRITGRELSDIIPWFDRRSIGFVGQGEAFERTGLRNSYKYGLYKFLWVLEHSPIDRSRTVWLSVCDYVVYKLTGAFVTEPGFAARTYLYDIGAGCWDEERMAAFGLNKENFPCVGASGETAGIWEEKKIPVALAGHDHVCAAFAMLYSDPGRICDSAGTSETYIGLAGKRGGEFRQEDGLQYGPFGDSRWYYMANIPSSGHSLEWYRKKLQLTELSYEELNRNLEELPKGPTGILYFPWLTGSGSPYYEASMQGALLGLREAHSGLDIMKGMIEGIQYQGALLLEQIEKVQGVQIGEVICGGGAVNNHALMQMKADILGRKVLVPACRETTALGAAAVFLERGRGREAAAGFLLKLMGMETEYLPGQGNREDYKKILLKRFLPMAEMLRDFMTHI